MKKKYVAPRCANYVIPLRPLCVSIEIKDETISDSGKIGFSKGFSGGVEDDEPSSSTSLWGEE